jgi:hypothetical protein
MPVPLEIARPPRLVACVLASIATAVAVALGWAQFRGFDMLDGAFYFLLYKDPADFTDTQTRFHLLAHPIWLLCGQNIVAFRFASIALMSLASWFFWRKWKGLLRTDDQPPVCFWPLWMATIAGLCWVPVALTYNSLATLFDLLALAVILSLLEPGSAGKPGAVIRWPRVGVLLLLIYALVLTKAPAAGALAVCGYFLFCLDPRLGKRPRRVFIVCGSVLALVAAGSLLVAVTRADFSLTKAFYIKGLLFTPNSIRELFVRYWSEIVRIAPAVRRDFLWTIGPTILAVLGALAVPVVASRKQWWRQGALILLLGAFSGSVVARRLWDSSYSSAVSGEGSRFYLLLWGSLLPVWLVGLRRGDQSNPGFMRRHVSWVLALFILPLISSFGSTNTVYVSALHETVCWAAGLLLVADQIAATFASSWFRHATAALITFGAAAHIFSGHFLRPYMNQPSLWKQTESADIGYPATRLKIDPALAAFLHTLTSTLDVNGYKPGDDVFGFFNLPGVIYAIGAKEPGAPWYFGTWYHQENLDELKLDRVPLARRQSAWIITQADVGQFRLQFLKCGIDFPDAYRMLGQATNPVTGLEIGVWKPLGRP